MKSRSGFLLVFVVTLGLLIGITTIIFIGGIFFQYWIPSTLDSHKEGLEKEISNNHFLDYSLETTTLNYRIDENSSVILIKEIDSIGWDNNYIIGFSNNEYFLILNKDPRKVIRSPKKDELIKDKTIRSIKIADPNKLENWPMEIK